MSDAERSIMEHAVAWRHRRRLYRNHFIAGPDHVDWPTLLALCEQRLMYVRREPSSDFGGMTVFAVTEAGKKALAERQRKSGGR